ncbi:MAG TPA: ABC transporter substrate-binding protein [Geobacter sp.]|nr:ABC transporter substrate-binding protein [Geobacter sp.]
MRYLSLLIMAVIMALQAPAWGAEILVLQSSRSQAYEKALRGFRSTCKLTEQTLVMTDFAEIDVQRMVREERPRLVLAVGDKALEACRKVREVPVVSMLALSLNLGKHSPGNVGGVAMTVAPEQYFRLFDALGAGRVGVLYNPKKTGLYLKRALAESRQRGLKLVAEPVHDPRELQSKLEMMKESVDALWMLPDSTVVTTVNLEAFLLFSMAHNVPTVTFTCEYLREGAAAALDIDPLDMGVQAGELALSLLRGGTSRKVPVLDPRKVQQHNNESVLRSLGLKLP